MQESCEDQNDHEYSMSLKEALEIMVDPDSVKSMFFYQIGKTNLVSGWMMHINPED